MTTTPTPVYNEHGENVARDYVAELQAREELREARAALELARATERAAILRRLEAIQAAREVGLSLAQIAGLLGISRQAVHLIAS